VVTEIDSKAGIFITVQNKEDIGRSVKGKKRDFYFEPGKITVRFGKPQAVAGVGLPAGLQVAGWEAGPSRRPLGAK
jgi:hypothetical protein